MRFVQACHHFSRVIKLEFIIATRKGELERQGTLRSYRRGFATRSRGACARVTANADRHKRSSHNSKTAAGVCRRKTIDSIGSGGRDRTAAPSLLMRIEH